MELEKTNQNKISKKINQNAILKETTGRIAVTLVIATLPFWVYLFYLYAEGYKTEAKSSLIFYSIVTGVLLVVFAFGVFWETVRKCLKIGLILRTYYLKQN